MQKRHIYFIILLIAVLLSACSKSPGDCFTKTGNTVSDVRDLSAFTAIMMLDNVDVELIEGLDPKVEVIAGTNLIDKIKTEVIDSVLIISNVASCNFVRSYSQPLVAKVYFQKLDSIEYRSVGDLTCLSKIVNTDSFQINIYEGAGLIQLELQTAVSRLNFHYGTANLEVSGFSQVNYIYQASYGPINASDLITTYNYLENKSTNNTYVQANVGLGVTISSIGNVYYRGNPTISLSKNGSGELIPLP